MFISPVNMGILTYLWDIGLGFLVLSSSGHSRKCSFCEFDFDIIDFSVPKFEIFGKDIQTGKLQSKKIFFQVM